MLAFEKDEQLNVSTIAMASSLVRPTVSHHLKILKDAEILSSRKSGKEVFYRLNVEVIRKNFNTVLEYIDTNLK